MKPASLATAALVIAILSGTAGYYLGRNQAPEPALGRSTQAPVAQIGKPQSARPAGAGFSQSDLTQLRADLDREANPLARFKLALRNLEGWMNTDPKGALAWLKSQQPSGRRDEVIRMALGQFTENDPKAASQWALENLSGIEFNNALIRICEEWARRDGLEAATWLTALPATRERDAAMEGMFFAWAAEDPAAAMDFLKKNPGNDELSAILRYAAFAGWAKVDPQAAVSASLESSRTFEDPAQFANTLANWATIDLGESSRWLLENVKDVAEREAAVIELAGIFAHQSPEAGIAWVGKLNAGTERDGALNQFASEWANSDPASAASWAAAQNIGKLTDESVSEILHGFLAKDAKAFEAWRATLPDGPLKSRAQQAGAMAEDE
jgi:hypothetical protein